jgi:hypothetical protein
MLRYADVRARLRRLPNGMDGVAGLNQKVIRPGQTFKYEYTLPALRRRWRFAMRLLHRDEFNLVREMLKGTASAGIRILR